MHQSIYNVITKQNVNYIVPDLTDFMFQEGWRVLHTVNSTQVTPYDLEDSEEYFSNLQYPKDN